MERAYTMIPYTLIRSRRKTLALYITKDARLEARAPLEMSNRDIEQFIAAKEKWVASHLAEREQLNREKAAFRLDYGAMLRLCGRQYPLIAKEGKRAGFNGAHFYLPPGLPPEVIKQTVTRIYKTVAKNIFAARTAHYAEQMMVQATAVKISGAQTRWGSCSGKNSINFSWRLLMADDDVIDYVIVHELAHIREHNHSSRFWPLVENVLPDYQARQRKLKQLQKELAAQDWN
jgi:predicted metal-dependent hydrolase